MSGEYEESIYNLIPRPQDVPFRPPRHKSHFPGKPHPHDFEFGQNRLQGHATFGLPNGANAPVPQKFIRAHEKAPVLPEPTVPSHPKIKIKSPIPRKDDPPVMGLCSNKNFIVTNAVQAILSHPGKVPQDNFRWNTRPGYGEVPVYLRRTKAVLQRERDNFENYVRMQQEPAQSSTMIQLSNQERRGLLNHLKKKWDNLNRAYQGFSLAIDHEQKKRRKEELERQLAEVERDIKTLERNDVIMVVDA